MNRYKGIIYPVEKTPYGVFVSGDDIEQIKSSLLTIIMTKPGERVMEPDFGTPLHTIDIDKPPDLIIHNIRRMIASSIKRWEKRVQLSDITVTIVNTDNGFESNIQVLFIDPSDMQVMHQLTVQLPLGGVF